METAGRPGLLLPFAPRSQHTAGQHSLQGGLPEQQCGQPLVSKGRIAKLQAEYLGIVGIVLTGTTTAAESLAEQFVADI